MSKRNAVSYVKPDEPSFLKRLKQEIGYKEGPTVDTKREDLGPVAEDEEDTSEEQPTVVVLRPGDLTAEEAAKEKEKIEREPADLNARIIFKVPVKNQKCENAKSGEKQSTSKQSSEKDKNKKSKKEKNRPLLSFDTEEDDY